MRPLPGRHREPLSGLERGDRGEVFRGALITFIKYVKSYIAGRHIYDIDNKYLID